MPLALCLPVSLRSRSFLSLVHLFLYLFVTKQELYGNESGSIFHCLFRLICELKEVQGQGGWQCRNVRMKKALGSAALLWWYNVTSFIFNAEEFMYFYETLFFIH